MKEHRLKAVISGSFEKCKREIDLAREEFEDLGVEVLEPDPGGIFKTREDGFKPLATEIHLPAKYIEDKFCWNLAYQADLHYIVNMGGELGISTSFEMGVSLMAKKLLFTQEKIVIPKKELEWCWYLDLIAQIPVRSVPEAIEDTKKWLFYPKLYLPRTYLDSSGELPSYINLISF